MQRNGITIGRKAKGTIIAENDIPHDFLFTDNGIDTQIYGNLNLPPKYPLPDPLPTVGTINQRTTMPRKISVSNGGPFVSEIAGSKNGFPMNTDTGFITLTIPNNYIAGMLQIDYVLNTDAGRAYVTGQLRVNMARYKNKNAVVSILDTLPGTAIALAAIGGETSMKGEFSLSSISGAADSTQTADLQVTIGSVGTSAHNAHIRYNAKLISGKVNEAGTMAEGEITMSRM